MRVGVQVAREAVQALDGGVSGAVVINAHSDLRLLGGTVARPNKLDGGVSISGNKFDDKGDCHVTMREMSPA